MDSVLLHSCCAPCSISCIDALRNEGFSVTGFWYNPNIHPFTEYRSRRNTFTEYAGAISLPVLLKDEYGLRSFLQTIDGQFDNRCESCYRTRLEETARTAAQNGFSAFTTTLLISPYQNHDLIIKVANEVSLQHGVSFMYRDFRPLFREGQQKSRELNLYMQKYCGCIFSEEDRYCKKKK